MNAPAIEACTPRYLIVVGGSLGSLSAVKTLLQALPRHAFAGPDGAAMILALHRSADWPYGMAELLGNECNIPLSEPEDKASLQAGKIYLAPADYHLLIDDGHIALSVEGLVHFARPAIDPLFESAAHSFRERVLALVLTGNNEDGAAGAACVFRNGGKVWIQDPAEAEGKIMPGAAIAANPAADVMPLGEMARRLAELSNFPHGLWKEGA